MHRFQSVSILFVCLGAVLFTAGCDFPSDPPIKTPVTPPTHQSTIDTSKVLLPLSKGISWIYIAVKNQQSQSYETNASEIRNSRGLFFRVSYIHNPQGSPPRPILAFPSMLRNLPEGLGFYNTTGVLDTNSSLELKPSFVLPYPSTPGNTWSGAPSSEYTVRVVSKDTIIVDFTGEKRAVYRYEVMESGRSTTNFYVLPGKAFIRIDHPEATFHTVAWIGT
jgi:hypothetical protein